MKKKIAEGTKHIKGLAWHEVKDPRQSAKVVYGKDFSYYNYKDRTDNVVGETITKMIDLLSVGGTIYLVENPEDEEGYEIHRKDNRPLCIQYQMIQLDYLTGKFKARIDNPYYKQLLTMKFPARSERQSIANASSYFRTDDWLREKEQLQITKANVLDMLIEPIIELAQPRALQVMTLQEQKRIANLKTEANRLNVLSDMSEGKVYPNQEVTQALSEEIDFSVGYGEFGPYISKGTNKRHTTADTMEAYIVNAWLYNNGFRVETLDDQLEELDKLRQWFECYKRNAKRVAPTNIQAKTVEKFERLEWLEVEVGHILDQEKKYPENTPATITGARMQ